MTDQEFTDRIRTLRAERATMENQQHAARLQIRDAIGRLEELHGYLSDESLLSTRPDDVVNLVRVANVDHLQPLIKQLNESTKKMQEIDRQLNPSR